MPCTAPPEAAIREYLPHADLLLRLVDHANAPISLHLWSPEREEARLLHVNRALCKLARSTPGEIEAGGAIDLSEHAATLAATAAADLGELNVFQAMEPLVRDYEGGPCDTLIAVLAHLPDGTMIVARAADLVIPTETAAEPPSPSLSQDALVDVSRALAASIEAMLKTTGEADAGSSEYHSALQEFSEILASKPDIGTVTEAVNRIREHTDHLALEFRSTRAQLAESSKHIRELQETLVEAQRINETDELTTVGNRRHFDLSAEKTLEEAKGSGKPFCIVMADIDHFKSFNDEHGHQTGDMILRMIGRSLASQVRATDIVARYGGEEFAIVLPNTQLHQARIVGEKIRKDVAQRRFKKRISGESLGGVTISIGIAEWAPSKSLEQTIEDADRALYAAKRSGRNLVATSTN